MSTPPIIRLSRDVARRAAGIRFAEPVAYVYNPIEYARVPHERYLARFGQARGRVLLVGMNPGPWGMAQTGVPFGDPELVREWIGIDGPVEKPPREHPKVPIRGFASHRREGSGRRFWGWARDHAGTAEEFFRRCFVWNYCPLCFLGESGANVTPERLCAGDKGELCAICDDGLARLCRILEPRAVVGIGNFAERRLREVLGEDGAPIYKLLHPSPANPRANAGWSEEAERVLVPLGV